MAARQRAFSGAPWEERFGYARAVRHGNFVSVSGTVGINSDGSIPDGALAQARRALDIIVTALAELGASPHDVVRTRTFVTDMRCLDDVGLAHREVFGDVRPATSLVEVRRLVDDRCLLEIEADAIID
jgi:enamine deaminase RidA (YjgF/YER057c/UK114 family)